MSLTLSLIVYNRTLRVNVNTYASNNTLLVHSEIARLRRKKYAFMTKRMWLDNDNCPASILELTDRATTPASGNTHASVSRCLETRKPASYH